MSRRYEITIEDKNGQPVGDAKGNQIGPWHSHRQERPLAGALDIEFDIQTLGAGTIAAQSSTLVIRGLPMSVMKQSVNLSECICTLNAGFGSIGLPLGRAQSVHYGMILEGQIYTPYANWQGVNQSLNLGIINYAPVLNVTGALRMDGKRGENIGTMILRNMKAAYPGKRVVMSIADNLILPEDTPSAEYLNMGGYSLDIGSLSRGIMNDPEYVGIQIYMQKDFIVVSDLLYPLSGIIHNVALEELIGQPTWEGFNSISVKVPLRSDINVGEGLRIASYTDCKIYTPYGGIGTLLTTNGGVAIVARMQDTTFSGTFIVSGIRHVGAFRNPSADSWVSIITLTAVHK
ncbi:TPA: hypothetical protein QIF36_002403 [Enterobacter kobei]|nr:hypothetical protein [Enterobacter kobei]